MAQPKRVTVGEDSDIARYDLNRVNGVGDRRSRCGDGNSLLVERICNRVSPAAAWMAAASCGLGAVTVSPSGRVTVVGPDCAESAWCDASSSPCCSFLWSSSSSCFWSALCSSGSAREASSACSPGAGRPPAGNSSPPLSPAIGRPLASPPHQGWGYSASSAPSAPPVAGAAAPAAGPCSPGEQARVVNRQRIQEWIPSGRGHLCRPWGSAGAGCRNGRGRRWSISGGISRFVLGRLRGFVERCPRGHQR